MHRLLLITMLILISGCASDFGFQSQSQNVASVREFNFKSGISGSIPPGLCQIKQLQSERVGQGVVFFSNCNKQHLDPRFPTVIVLFGTDLEE